MEIRYVIRVISAFRARDLITKSPHIGYQDENKSFQSVIDQCG